MSTAEQTPAVLIVDDRPEKLIALQAVLSDLGLKIVTAESGRSALKHLLAETFAVILLDVQMPGMDGFETAALIRQRKTLEHTPIIFLTAYGDDMHVARGYSLGAVDFILAPVVPEILRTKVTVFIELHRKTLELHRRAEQWQRRARQLHKLNEASLAINSALGMDQLLRLVAERGVEIFAAMHVAVIASLGSGRSQTHKVVAPAAADGLEDAELRGQELEWLSTLEPGHVISWAGGPRYERYLNLEGIARTLEFGVPPKLSVSALTGRDGRSIGLMVMVTMDDSCDPVDDEALFLQYTQMTAVAIENTLFANAREANRLKDEFLATLSHELRTPLTAICGWLQILQLQDLPPETTHGLEIIDRSVGMQVKLIDDLLDISRVVAGKLHLQMRRTDFLATTQTAVDIVRPQLAAKGLQLDLCLGIGPTIVHGDAARLQQVVWNLLSNAIKFTPAKGCITVELSSRDGSLELRVSDTGQGIDPGLLSQVFDRFWQADSSTTRSHGGLGIGLALVRHVVEGHGGKVAVASLGEGQGATFTVVLPLACEQQSAVEPDRSATALAEATNDPATSLRGVRALVVEDQRDTREILTWALSTRGADVETVDTAAGAIERLEQSHFDLLVSDVGLPEMDGYALIRYLRHRTKGPHAQIPAIAVTALAHEDDKQKALHAGFDRHMAKPIDMRELAQTAASLMQGKPCLASVPAAASEAASDCFSASDRR